MKREEQIRLARQLLKSGVLSEESANAIKADFPELAESEDERIRKAIIHYLDYTAGGLSTEEQHRWIAYLEKQKEQKPAEWSEEPIVEGGTIDFEKELARIIVEVVESPNGEGPSLKEYASRLLSIVRKEIKPEWSEEDEKMIECCLRALDFYKTHANSGVEFVPPKFDIGGYLTSVNKVEDWLKSLRPHWKPSEEQMLALEYALGNGGTYNKEALKSLYEQLKEL